MNIPDKAIEAAAKVELAQTRPGSDWDKEDEFFHDLYRAGVREQLKAAAPFIAAQALRDAARVDFLEGYSENARLYREDVAADLRDRADEHEKEAPDAR